MFSFFSGLVTKKSALDRAPDDADTALADAAPAFVPPAPLAQVVAPVAPRPVAVPADVPSDAERALEAEIGVRHSWPATLLQHEEAMQYGDAARRNLISMIVELRDPKLGRILHDALYEERADGLRPEVLAALRRAYHDESLRDTYERFARIGNAAEREVARDGLLALDAGEG
jgi:hypothetical protein